jgi:WD40 repeat protein
MSKRLRSLLLIFLLSSALMITLELDAYEPSVIIGKPTLEDILYSPDGRFLATLTMSYVELLDAETLAPVTRVPVMYGRKLAFSPDSSLLAIFGLEEEIRIWHIDSETFLANIPVNTKVAAFSPDGKYLAYAKGDSVFLWDVDQREISLELTGDPQKSIHYPQRVTGIAFHPNSRILAVGSYRHTIALWDIETGKIHSYLDLKESYYPTIVSFSHDGNSLAATTRDIKGQFYRVRLWNVSTGDSRYLSGYFHDLVFTPDDQYLLAGGGDGNLHIIRVDTFKVERKPALDPVPPADFLEYNRLERLTFHPDGWKLAILINYSRVCIWDAQSFSRLQTIYGYGCSDAQAVYLPELNRIITGVDSYVLSFWDATTGELLKTIEFYAPMNFLEASHDGREIAITLPFEAQVWDASTAEQLNVFHNVGIVTRGIEFSPSGRYLAALNLGNITMCDTKAGGEVRRIYGSGSDRSLLLFTPDEKQILTIPRDQEKTVFWDIDTGEPVDEIGYAGPLVNVGVDFVQARAAEEGIEIRLLKSNKLLSQIPVELEIRYPQQFFRQVKFHPSGNVLYIRYQDGIDPGEYGFYSTHTGELISSVSGIRDLQFTPDGRYMFMVDDEWQLGLYLTSDVLGKSISSAFAVHPSGKKITTLGYIKRNQLLQNYPNPFNPETWIPYHLEKDSEVTIRIYNPAGELIRTLSPGRKSAGTYLTKSEAAHWDGKNEAGEQAASGVYFYNIQAGEFTVTKKMVIAD